MKIVILVAALAPALATAQSRYREVATKFIETMMERGTDRYGAVHSPLFAATLDLNTLSLPVEKWPAELKPGSSGMISSIGFGLPDPPVGIRTSDRAPIGNNLDHDIMLLRAMYALTEITGNKKYAGHADAYLRFWIANCQSPETGLMYYGEHASWDFLTERPFGDVHEIGRKFPFYEKLYEFDPHRALRNADGLWFSQIGDKKNGDFSRHAAIGRHHPGLSWNFPRHAGFYIWAYAHAYAQSRDPKYIERADLLIESATGKRARTESLLLDPNWKTENSLDPTLRLMLWDSAALVPEPKASAWRKIVREMDEEAFAEAANPRPWRWGRREPGEEERIKAARERWARRYPGLLKHGRIISPGGTLQTESTTLSRHWYLGYGSSGFGAKGLMALTRYHQTRDPRFFREAVEAADVFLAEGFPNNTLDLWPKSPGQVISLLVALAREAGIAPEKQKRYLAFAREVADKSIPVFLKNGLFRADGAADHYEAITGAGDLVWALLQLEHPLPHNDVNW